MANKVYSTVTSDHLFFWWKVKIR